MQQLSEIDKAYKKQDDDYVDGLIEQLNKTQEERIKDAIEMFGAEEYERMTGAKIPQDVKELAEKPEKDSCPLATQDVKLNLANRKKAIDVAQYGPQNPNEPNEDYWKAKAKEFGGDVASAKKMLCGNCSAFNLKKKILDCIKKGIGGESDEVAMAGQLGYCEIFDFKCASKRTCSAWIVGGAITDDKELKRTISQTPAPKKDRIKGSATNKAGTASTKSTAGSIEVSEQVEETLRNKIAEFKKSHPNRKAPSLGTLKKVFRRGAGAFSTSYRPTIGGGRPNSRNAWAIARVNKFLKMAGGGSVKKAYREADGDLLESIFEDGDLLELNCGIGEGGFKEGNTCAKGGGGSETTKDAPTKDVEERKGALRRIAEGAKMKAQYGASKAGEIKDYLQSPKGRELRENIGKALKIAYKGGIGIVTNVQSQRFTILISALINPVLGSEALTYSVLSGFVKGAFKEYRSQKEQASSKGIARFQAMGSVVTLARTPSDSEIADYITDEILVAIKEEVTNKKDFCITTTFAYDPSQDRDSSGKWSGSGTIIDTPKTKEEAIQRYSDMEGEAPHRLEPIAKWEEKNKNASYERALVTDQKGNQIIEKAGDWHSVSFTPEEQALIKSKDVIITHNHPSENGFSSSDLFFAIASNMKEMRAVSKFRTFSAERPKSGWPNIKVFQSAYKKIEAIIGTKMVKALDSGRVTTDYANRIHHHMVAKELAKDFGISYKVNQTR